MKQASIRFVRLLILTASLAGLIGWVSGLLSPHMRIGINASDSLPGWVYWVKPGDKASLQAGDTIGFYPQANPYYPAAFLFIKQVAGVAGDVVGFGESLPLGTDFYINGQRMGIAKAESQGGDALQHSQPGRIPPGFVFVWTPHPDSFDSRYALVGLIPVTQVVGRAQRVF